MVTIVGSAGVRPPPREVNGTNRDRCYLSYTSVATVAASTGGLAGN